MFYLVFLKNPISQRPTCNESDKIFLVLKKSDELELKKKILVLFTDN